MIQDILIAMCVFLTVTIILLAISILMDNKEEDKRNRR